MQQFQRTEFGDYVLHDRIGAGGMAEIFLATAQGIEGFEKRLVIKRILPTFSGDDQFVRMFIEEAKLCVALRHPNIVQVYDLGEIDGQYFIAMEYVDGRDLLKTLAACGKKRIGFPTDIALYIVMEVLKGLDYAHNLRRPDGQPLGIIHRDVSPSNVLLSFEGEVKIADFGIAKASTREKTETGILKGKFGYMAPEQVTGTPIDHRADIFAMGIVLYELLTGHRLFAGKNDLAVLERVRDALIDPPPRHYRPDLATELEGIVMKALACDARQRFQVAADLHDALYEYTFRSRATIGPPQLAKFMQELFLSDQEEIQRRQRMFLPVLAASGPPPTPDTGPIDTAGVPVLVKPEPEALSMGGFDEATPLLEGPPEEALRHVQEDISLSSFQSNVAFIAADEQWEKDKSSLEELTSDARGGAKLEEPTDILQNDPPRAPRTPGGSDEAIDVLTGEVLSIGLEQEVRALRRAREENDPTDLDLDGQKRRDVEVSLERIPSNFDTVIALAQDGDDEEDDEEDGFDDDELSDPGFTEDSQNPDDPDAGFAQQSDRNFTPAQIVERTLSASGRTEDDFDDHADASEDGTEAYEDALADTHHEADAAPDDPDARHGIMARRSFEEIEDPATRDEQRGVIDDPDVATAEQRADHGPDDDDDAEDGAEEDEDDAGEETAEVEPTVRFDSSESLRRKIEARLGRSLVSEPEDSELGTIEVLESDLPTSEVSESALMELGFNAGSGDSGVEPVISEVDARALSARTLEDQIRELRRGHDADKDQSDRALVPLGDTGTGLSEDTKSDNADLYNSREETNEDRPRDGAFTDSTSIPIPPPILRKYLRGRPDDFDDKTESAELTEEHPAEVQPVAGREVLHRGLSRRRPITAAKRAQSVLITTKEDTPEGELNGDQLPRRHPLRSASKAHSVVPRRRIAAKSSLSVVNPRIVLEQNERTPTANDAIPTERGDHAAPHDEVTDSGEMAAAATPQVRIRETRGEHQAALLPERRSSSGVTAALNEAAAIEEELAQLRAEIADIPSAGGPELTTSGSLAEEMESGASLDPLLDDDDDDDDDDDGKTDLHRAILRRQSRRRFATNSVVLFGEDGHTAPDPSDDSSSMPIITNAGRLEDAGADDLFGALSMIDSSPLEINPPRKTRSAKTSNFVGTGADEEISIDTESGLPNEEIAPLVKKPPLIAPSVSMELHLPVSKSGAQKNGAQKNGAQKYDVQKNGAQKNGAQKNGAQKNGAQKNGAQKNGAQKNGSSTEDLSQTGLGSLAPGTEDFAWGKVAHDPASGHDHSVDDDPEDDTASVGEDQVMNVSALTRSSLPPDDDDSLSERPALDRRLSSGIEIEFGSLRGGADDPIEDIDESHSTAVEEAEIAAVRSPRHDEDLTPEASLDTRLGMGDEPPPRRAELRLISDSFDIGADIGAAPPARPEKRKPSPQVKVRTPTPVPKVEAPKPRAKAPVAGRGPAKELNRPSPNGRVVPQPMRPPQASAGLAPLPIGTPLGAPIPAAVPSASQAYPPLARTPEPSVGNKLVIPLVLLAVALAIAAAVVLSLNPHFSSSGAKKIPTMPPAKKIADSKMPPSDAPAEEKKEEKTEENKLAPTAPAEEKKLAPAAPIEEKMPAEDPEAKLEKKKTKKPKRAVRADREDRDDEPEEAVGGPNTGFMRFECEETAQIQIFGPTNMKLPGVQKKTVPVPPGRYLVKVLRDNKLVAGSTIAILKAQTARVACP